MQTQTFDPFSNQFRDWDRFFRRDGDKLCSWSYTGPNATGLKSPEVCDLITQPVNNVQPTPIVGPTTNIIVNPNPEDPSVPPVTVTPEPGTILLVMFGLLAVFVGGKFKASKW
jgi:hypothetical protein